MREGARGEVRGERRDEEKVGFVGVLGNVGTVSEGGIEE